MKLLVIGIDGGDERIFDAMEMPHLASLRARGTPLRPVEDLWSRGWVEMLVGVHGRHTGAFYDKPKLDGSHGFTQKFGSKDIAANSDVTSIWEIIESAGCRLGVMNVPTTMPASKVNGFLVAGAGGGLGALGSQIPDEACYPRDVAAELSSLGYILDTRILSSGIMDINQLFDRLQAMTRLRGEAFAKLCARFKPDFGFVAFMGTSRLQNLAMSEIDPLLRIADGEKLNPPIWGDRIKQLYRELDSAIEQIVQETNPEHFLIVADHGAVPYLHRMNVNRFLVDIGMQRELKGSGLRRMARSIVKSVLPPDTARKLAKKSKSAVTLVSPKVDWDATSAFGSRYVPGIYLNDKLRFKGPVDESSEQRLIEQIISAFNATSEAKNHHLSARPYRQQYRDAKFEKLLPDIWIDKPDTVFVEGMGGFVTTNENFAPLESMRNVNRDMHSGVKGRFPICLLDQAAASSVTEEEFDLTVVYRIIQRIIADK